MSPGMLSRVSARTNPAVPARAMTPSVNANRRNMTLLLRSARGRKSPHQARRPIAQAVPGQRGLLAGEGPPAALALEVLRTPASGDRGVFERVARPLSFT